jgi:hypothetical protein
MMYETPWDLAAKILRWNERYAAEAEEARQRERNRSRRAVVA